MWCILCRPIVIVGGLSVGGLSEYVAKHVNKCTISHSLSHTHTRSQQNTLSLTHCVRLGWWYKARCATGELMCSRRYMLKKSENIVGSKERGYSWDCSSRMGRSQFKQILLLPAWNGPRRVANFLLQFFVTLFFLNYF